MADGASGASRASAADDAEAGWPFNETVVRSRPARLDSYRASSAAAMRLSPSVPSPIAVAIPALTLTLATVRIAATAALTRSTTVKAPGLAQFGSRIANSSPP